MDNAQKEEVRRIVQELLPALNLIAVSDANLAIIIGHLKVSATPEKHVELIHNFYTEAES